MNNLVYCFARNDERTHPDAAAAYARWERLRPTDVRSQYPCTGWTIKELVGSQWVSVHTGAMKTIKNNPYDRNGHEYLLAADDYAYLGIGIWHEGRYIIEHSIRYDVLTPAEQLTWVAWRVTYCRKEVTSANEDYQRHRTTSEGHNKQYWLVHRKSELERAQAALNEFCAVFGFARGEEYAVLQPTAEPVQMRLFI